MYNPPTPEIQNHCYEYYKEAYDLGYNSKDGVNPYKESGHERDTTFEDECHFQFYSGYSDQNEE